MEAVFISFTSKLYFFMSDSKSLAQILCINGLVKKGSAIDCCEVTTPVSARVLHLSAFIYLSV